MAAFLSGAVSETCKAFNKEGWHVFTEMTEPLNRSCSSTGQRFALTTIPVLRSGNPNVALSVQYTMADLEARGARFTGPGEKEDYGVTVMLNVPGADDIMLYEPRHPIAHSL